MIRVYQKTLSARAGHPTIHEFERKIPSLSDLTVGQFLFQLTPRSNIHVLTKLLTQLPAAISRTDGVDVLREADRRLLVLRNWLDEKSPRSLVEAAKTAMLYVRTEIRDINLDYSFLLKLDARDGNAFALETARTWDSTFKVHPFEPRPITLSALISGVAEGEIDGLAELGTGSIGGLTMTGAVKKSNGDAILAAVKGKQKLLAVADSMDIGGNSEIAAAIALEELGDLFENDDEFSLAAGLRLANLAILKQKMLRTIERRAGTTMVAALMNDETHKAELISVGDSRLYLFRKGEIWLLLREDGLVARRFSGDLPFPLRGQVAADYYQQIFDYAGPAKDFLLNAVGLKAELKPEAELSLPLETGDLLILATDGLHNYLSWAQLNQTLAANQHKSPLEIARALCDATETTGDNFSALVIAL